PHQQRPSFDLGGVARLRRLALALGERTRQRRVAALELDLGAHVPDVHRVAPAHPRIARVRDRALDRLEKSERAVEIAEAQVIQGEIDAGIGDDLRIADLFGDLRSALIVLARQIPAADLGEAPAERVEHAAAPGAVADALAEIVSFLQ